MFFEHWTSKEPANATINQSNYSKKLITKPSATPITLTGNCSSHTGVRFESKLSEPDRFSYDAAEVSLGTFKVMVHPTNS